MDCVVIALIVAVGDVPHFTLEITVMSSTEA